LTADLNKKTPTNTKHPTGEEVVQRLSRVQWSILALGLAASEAKVTRGQLEEA
tara:strand:+ start:6684 stop:6842 length:159 start_codon:yes stop_codon:yes gene_type:complete